MSVLSPYSASDKAPKALSLFQTPNDQVSILSHFYEDIRPVSQFQQMPIEFDCQLQEFYTDLSRSQLFLKVRILKADGTSLPDGHSVSPVNLFFHSLFKQVDVYLNRTLVSSSGDLYAYKSYIKTLFNSTSQEKTSSLQGQMFFKDTAGFMDETATNSGNFGLFERHQLAKGSKQFDLFGLPLSDCFQLDRFMLNGVHLRILMLRNSPEFCLFSDEDDDTQYQVRIEDAFLRLVKLKINPAILLSHSKVLKEVSAKYPYVKTDLKVANIVAGQTSFSWDMINSSYLPRTVIVAFVDSSALIGSLKKNPFNFDHFILTQISVLVNGVSTPGAPIHANYDVNGTHGSTIGQVLQRLYDTKRRKSEIGAIGDSDHSGLELSRNDVRKGYAFYLFDLEPVLNDDMYFDLLKTGSLSLNAMFGNALTTNVSCLLYSESYGMIEIDESRVVRLA